ncbi:hypothetical protein NZD89_21520 [Alicyclobacillus fastidiosus]|uniref:DUF4179 domain-containing protein n=1 Tax=Alicyclobacillus fastidiosus TaxID=392011 RepID=A0ABY6ZDC5_9BACL|nr:hypothetical protein [Alicyclobacillus fastidiosus]WAH40846.1 hypothetical protein NZD89_21520 [Alicyclobacillus fastidiosus]GMA62332.1 hypothetical protein GCM10025859_27720 [Alicyclobacillus fastidiosus]
MTDTDDKDLRHIMQQLSEVPFRDDLKSRILDAAQERELPIAKANRRRRTASWYAGLVSGIAAACAVVGVGVSLYMGHPSLKETSATEDTVPFQLNAKAYGLAPAPLQIADVRIGTLPGDPTDSDVLANVKNTSDTPVHKSDVFGVLSFTPNDASQGGAENWLTFVNGPSETVEPHQTVVWGFHPTGSTLHGASSNELVETPHLRFYAAHLAPLASAAQVWTKSPVSVGDLQVEPRVLDHNRQSVQIDARLTNTSNQPFHLKTSRAVIWFASSSDQSFLSVDSIRFMYHLTPEYADQNWPTVLAPGQSTDINFRVISDRQSDFFSRAVHVMIIKVPPGGF